MVKDDECGDTDEVTSEKADPENLEGAHNMNI